MRNVIVKITVLTTLFVFACTDDEPAQPVADVPGADTAGDVDPTSCTTHAECAGAVADLGACMVAACTDGICQAATSPDMRACDDGDPCTLDSWCEAGECKSGTIQIFCDDGNSCTADGCDSEKGCAHIFVIAECDDGDFCTDNDRCDSSAVCAGEAIGECGCTIDSDCIKFDDGNGCNGLMKCTAGQCKLDPDIVVVCTSNDLC